MPCSQKRQRYASVELPCDYCLGDPDPFSQLRTALHYGEAIARRHFPVGTVIDDFWKSLGSGETYHMPLIVVDYRQVILYDGSARLGAILLRQNALPPREFIRYDKTKIDRSEELFCLRTYFGATNQYLSGCSEALRQNIVASFIRVELPAGPLLAAANWFAPSLEELGFDSFYQTTPHHYVWEYFDNTTSNFLMRCDKRVFKDMDGRPQSCLLRSENPQHPCDLFAIDDVGSICSHLTEGVFSCAPACVIA